MDEEVLMLLQWRARLMLLSANDLQSGSAKHAVVNDAGGVCSRGAVSKIDGAGHKFQDPRALHLQKSAVQLLEVALPQSENETSTGHAVLDCNETEDLESAAQLTMQVAELCCELGKWKQAMRIDSFHE